MILPLFKGFGVELEYMIVDGATLDVRPWTDRVMKAASGAITSDFENGDIAWSNELTAHVIEMKTNGPAMSLGGLAERFQSNVRRINGILNSMGARLMPGGAHPWMNPFKETQLWAHDYSAVYEAYNKIFNCKGHGWSNLQSTHLNLPFDGDEEFGRLHAAIRLVLPILPALSASTPVLDGRLSGAMDMRLRQYSHHMDRIPSLIGRIVPEAVFSETEYNREIMGKIFADLEEHDPKGLLREEFANARGAIARFSRGTIEIRVLDIQECPAADIAIARLICAVLRAHTDERWISLEEQKGWSVDALAPMLEDGIENAERSVLRNGAYLEAFGWRGAAPLTAGELWRHLAETLLPQAFAASASGGIALDAELFPLRTILDRGPLARRIVAALGGEGATPSRDDLHALYGGLCDCLAKGQMFEG